MKNILHKEVYTRVARRSVTGFAAILALLAFFSSPALCRVLDGVAIVVNRDAILVSEINEAMMPMVQEYRAKFSGEELQERLAGLRETVINQAIETKLILQVAKANAITANESEVDSRIEIVKKRFPSEEEFLRALGAKGLSLREYREQVVEQVVVQDTVKRVLGAEISVQDEEIEEYYKEHPDEFHTTPKVKLAQIFFRVPRESTDEQIEEIRQRLQQLHILLEEGADFSELASKYSEGPYRETGGLVGVIGPGEILPDLEQVALSLKSGEISPVVHTPYGLHILKALEAAPARKIEFEEAKPFIEERIAEQRRNEKYQEWMEKLKETAYIDIRI